MITFPEGYHPGLFQVVAPPIPGNFRTLQSNIAPDVGKVVLVYEQLGYPPALADF
ncbi:MAG: hypothetical protein AAFY30_04245 [Cyanobacteria bacterium J06642_12]